MNIAQLYSRQKAYNEKIRKEQKLSKEEWTQIYLLGLVSEVDQVLNAISWKRHRKNYFEFSDLTNMGYEFADLFKYVMSMFELWGFSSEDVIKLVSDKSQILELQYEQEFEPIPTDRPIVISDIDGTLGDWRRSFEEWLHTKGIYSEVEDPVRTLRIDEDMAMRYSDYYTLKEEFEASGQYRHIHIYYDGVSLLRQMKELYNAYIIIVTARPADRYRRIWLDSWLWLKEHQIPADKLIIGSDPRVLLADSIQTGQKVIMLDDDPGLMMRGANSGIKVFARAHPYNSGATHSNIRRLVRYTDIPTEEYFK